MSEALAYTVTTDSIGKEPIVHNMTSFFFSHYDSIYIKLKNRQNRSELLEVRTVVALEDWKGPCRGLCNRQCSISFFFF